MEYFRFYSRKRLLGDHVPYAVEAWPEGNQRHLSAESALYCRAVTEGLFGFRPTGLSSFAVTPRLPSGWDTMALRNVIAFNGKKIDIEVVRNNEKINVAVLVNGKLVKKVDAIQGRIIDIRL
jgi:cellobiose phosphorylase